ncbi:YfbK domain-containing protein [Flavobacterium sp. ZS1P14]|uniref:vWA domain-containing protein n=1 Tax=Flavobacterium sp. ZS1P14 TaxID=3401729 RepID=UPI003AAB2BB6
MKSLKLISLALAMLFSILSFGQEIKITGTVTDETKTALPGVVISIKGTRKGTQTDSNGHYAIQAQKGNQLVFSYIGMNSQTIKIENSNVINVRLKNNSEQLDEVVVVGYGNISKETQTGSIAAVSGKKKENYYSNNYTKALQGQVAGVATTENKIKTSLSIMIRGVRSSDTGSPLYDKVNINPPLPADPNGEEYENFVENQFDTPKNVPLSTFSIDVDNASYTNIRRFINNGQAVPKDAVRIEEMMNFFKYSYPQPKDKYPFSINTEYSNCPWNSKHNLLKIGLQGKNVPTEQLPASNLVFLIDVSGSMSDPNKLPLLKQSMKILVNELRKEDKVAIVVYAGAAGMVLPPTTGDKKQIIINALDNLSSGGSTAGGAGIDLAYKTAIENFIKGGNNRVILATDGDFNVGSSSNKDMQTLIEEKRKSGVFLTCLGYGMGNYKDSKMEILANKGNGNYAYIDNIQEANRFLGKEFKGSLFAIAKDVKIQIEFNPKHVQAYRLIGYENRKLRPEDFKNDAIDAGELGSGHTVTALYEIIPTGVESDYSLPDLKYTKTANTSNYSNELATIKFRYKKADENKSIEMIQTIENKSNGLSSTSDDFKFSAAVAWFGLKLRDSKLIAVKDSQSILKLTKQGLSKDPEGYKAEFMRLVETVQ